MINKRTLLAIVFLCLGAALLHAADFWKQKKYTEWSQKEAQQMLKDSPWARAVQVRMESGGGGRGGGGRGGGRRGGGGGGGGIMDTSPSGGERGMGGAGGMGGSGGGLEGIDAVPSITVVVRWHSALAIRHAVARARFGDEVTTSPEAARMLARQETQYVVGIAGLPMQMMRPNLKPTALLRVKGKEPIPAQDVKGDRDQRSVNLYLFFPRSTPITLEDQEVEVALKLGTLDIKRKFKLKDMVYEGKLEL